MIYFNIFRFPGNSYNVIKLPVVLLSDLPSSSLLVDVVAAKNDKIQIWKFSKGLARSFCTNTYK